MPGSINGVGTTYIGVSDPRPDGTCVTTEWVIVLFVPIIPLRSVRLARDPGGDFGVPFIGSGTGYLLVQKLPLYWPQVLGTYVFVVNTFFWWAGVIWFLGTQLNMKHPTHQLYAAGLAPTLGAMPFVVKWWLRRREQRVLTASKSTRAAASRATTEPPRLTPRA